MRHSRLRKHPFSTLLSPFSFSRTPIQREMNLGVADTAPRRSMSQSWIAGLRPLGTHREPMAKRNSLPCRLQKLRRAESSPEQHALGAESLSRTVRNRRAAFGTEGWSCHGGGFLSCEETQVTTFSLWSQNLAAKGILTPTPASQTPAQGLSRVGRRWRCCLWRRSGRRGRVDRVRTSLSVGLRGR